MSTTSPPPADTGLRVTRDGGITTLLLDRPERFNALSESLLIALQEAIDAVDDRSRVVVIKASGRAFCAGHDLKEMRSHHEREWHAALFRRCSGVMNALLALPQPVIASVQGIATAAGCQLVANADLAVAAGSARFAVSGINTGLFCSTPAVPLSRNVGRKRAFEMLMTGEFIDATTAREWGLVNRVVPDDELDTAVQALCQQIIDKSAVAVATGKALFYRQLDTSVDNAYAMASEAMACNMMSDDVAEGIDAFMEKRPPRWQHR